MSDDSMNYHVEPSSVRERATQFCYYILFFFFTFGVSKEFGFDIKALVLFHFVRYKLLLNIQERARTALFLLLIWQDLFAEACSAFIASPTKRLKLQLGDADNRDLNNNIHTLIWRFFSICPLDSSFFVVVVFNIYLR